jgi:hypothetical protein
MEVLMGQLEYDNENLCNTIALLEARIKALEAKYRQAVHEDQRRITQLEKDLEWYNEGVALLMALMGGRGIVAQDSAERAVFEEWRKRGRVTDEHRNNTSVSKDDVSDEYDEKDTLP